LVELFDWEGQDAEINLSFSSIEPFDDYVGLDADDRDAEIILADWYGVKPENIVIVHGAQEGIFLAYLALRPKTIYIPIPSYPPIIDQAKILGIDIVYTGLVPDIHNSIISLANPNNPTGLYIKLDDILSDNIVVVDEIFKFFVDDEPYYHENAIIICSTSKFYNFKDRKVGWIVASEEFAKRIRLVKDLVTPDPIYDKVLIKYIFRNYDFFRERSINIVRRNIDILRKNNRYFKVRYENYMPIALLEREGLDSMDFCRGLLESENVLLTPSIFFGLDGGLRICLGYEDTHILEEGLRRLNSFCEMYFGR
jgi:aspartate/methionine/tyrosine aminotransferase